MYSGLFSLGSFQPVAFCIVTLSMSNMHRLYIEEGRNRKKEKRTRPSTTEHHFFFSLFSIFLDSSSRLSRFHISSRSTLQFTFISFVEIHHTLNLHQIQLCILLQCLTKWNKKLVMLKPSLFKLKLLN